VEDSKFDYVDAESLVIDGEPIHQVIEYAAGKLLLKVSGLVLLVENWKVIHKINVLIYGFQLLPGFNEQTFPFVIARSREKIELFHTTEFTFEEIVTETPLDVSVGHSFLTMKSQDSIKLHFTSRHVNRLETEFDQWHCKTIGADMIKWLERNQRLPPANLK